MGIWQQRPRDQHATERVVAYDIETVVDTEPADSSFPPIPEHRPVTAGFLAATRVAGVTTFSLDVIVCEPGGERDFYTRVDANLSPGVVGIGWNSRGFDNPVLRLGALRHRVFGLEGLARQTQAGRYGAIHCDLADQFSSYGSSRTLSLAAVCDALEIPVKTSVHGSDVGALWRDGHVEAVKRYVAEDCIATWLVWAHLAAWRTGEPAEMVLPLTDFAAWIETTPGLEPFLIFASCPPVRWARMQAPGLRAQAALAVAERRLAHERDEAAFAESLS